jgi:hypothetical protein
VKTLKEQMKQLELKMEENHLERSEIENKCQLMAQLMTSLDIENDTQKKHIQELEQFVILLSTALTNQEGDQVAKTPGNQTDAAMVRNFANQFNVSINVESIEKYNKKKNEKLSLSQKI